MRVFNGSGWRFNRHWDGINASFKPALTQNTGGSVFTSAGTQGSADTALCWIWVDEDYNPSENRRIAPLVAPTVAAPVGIPEVWQSSHTDHPNSPGGEWKVGSKPGAQPTKGSKTTVSDDGVVIKHD